MNYKMQKFISNVIGAWLEEEILNLNSFYFPDISDNIYASQFSNIRTNNYDKYLNNLIDIGLIYKKLSPVFRWIGNAIVTNAMGAVHCKPIYKDKLAICNAIANFVDILPRNIGNKFGIFKSPLKILTEINYELNYQFAYDEISLLFALLCESMGINTIVVISEINGKIQIGCKTATVYSDEQDTSSKKDDYYKNYTVFDFSTQPVKKSNLNYIQKNIIAEFDVIKDIEIDINSIDSYPIVPFAGKGIAYRQYTNWWNDNQVLPNVNPTWFNKLVSSRIDYMNEDFNFLKTVEKNNEKTVAYNKGVETTGAIIALLANYIGNNYDVVREYVLNNIISPNPKTYNAYISLSKGNFNAIYDILDAIFRCVRNRFKYCEETVGVEQIASPLNILYIDSFYPFIQKYDCDDLTLLFLTLAESINFKNNLGKKLFNAKARLGGTKNDVAKIKYHVYPVIEINGENTVYDVSIVDTIGWEMDRGNNYQDFEVNHPEKYQNYLKNDFDNNIIIF